MAGPVSAASSQVLRAERNVSSSVGLDKASPYHYFTLIREWFHRYNIKTELIYS
jgi:hypothetical protein